MEVQMNTDDPNDMAALLAELSSVEAAEKAAGDEVVAEVPNVEMTEDVAPAPAQTSSGVSFDENALLADLNAPISADEPVDEDALNALAATVARAEAYSSQPAGASVEPAKTKGRKTGKSAEKAASAPREPRKSLSDLPDDTFMLFTGEVAGPANKEVTLKLRPAQVKIAEKFDNLFQSIAANKLPSRYVVTAMKRLTETGTMTSTDLNGTFKAEGLGDGTASSQTGQIMALFSVVGIANRAGQALTMRTDSVIAEKLKELIATTPVAA